MASMKTLHVIGYKDSGKTTLLSRWIAILKKEGYKVAVLKHHGHTESLTMPSAATDTMQYFESGADVAAVAGAGAMQMLLNSEPSFQEMVGLVLQSEPDILFIEGYKQEVGDKVVLLRDKSDWDTLSAINNIRLVVGLPEGSVPIPSIHSRTEEQQLDEWLLSWTKGV